MLRIAHVPSAHPYVAQVVPALAAADYPSLPGLPGPASTVGTPLAARLPDPVPLDTAGTPGVWWPPAVLDAGWLARHVDGLDAVHVHFGFEGRTRAQLDDWLDAVRAAGLPLVLTVHDLANPHLDDQTAHEQALGRLVGAADHVLTLTPGAARAIADRWGVAAQVLPHPQVVPDATLLGSDDGRTRTGRIGMHLGAVRAAVDPLPWLAALLAAAGELGLRLEVVANDEILQRAGRPRRVLDAVRQAVTDAPHAAVRVVPRMPDAQLHAWVAGLDAVVLPYRHGTHSGWVEMCWDLGTSVLAPAVGHLAEQHPDPGFLATFDPADPGSLAPALRTLPAARDAAGPVPWGSAADRLAERRRQAVRVRTAHEQVYARLVTAATGPTADPTADVVAGAAASATPASDVTAGAGSCRASA